MPERGYELRAYETEADALADVAALDAYVFAEDELPDPSNPGGLITGLTNGETSWWAVYPYEVRGAGVVYGPRSNVVPATPESAGPPSGAWIVLEADALEGTLADGDALTAGVWLNTLGSRGGSVSSVRGTPRFRANRVNGRPAIEFDGTCDATYSGTGTSGATYTVWMVVRYNGTAGTYGVLCNSTGTANNGNSLIIQSSQTRIYSGGGSAGALGAHTLLQTTHKLVRHDRTAAPLSTVEVDGVEVYSGNVGSHEVADFRLAVEYSLTTSTRKACDWAALLVYLNADGAKRAEVDAYLAAKYGIALP